LRVTVTGASDDLIEIDGDLREEFSVYQEDDDASILAFGDGTVLSVVYDKRGIWRVCRLVTGSAKFSKIEGDAEADTFDVATLDGDLRWCVLGTELVRPAR
jgi:hypothetical protein